LDNIVILVNGEFPTHSIPKSILLKSDNIFCCDGAINKLDEIGVMPKKIIGDMDSINVSLKIKYAEKIIQLDRQSDTDLEKTLKYCIENEYENIIILGFSGERDDHFLSNIFLCWEYSEQMNIKMYSNFGELSFVNGYKKYESFIGQQISIYSNNQNNKITTNGLKYHFNEESLSNMYSGSSNESINNTFSIETTDGSVMIYKLFKG
jgi:thiamine pyrophosphokinase